MGKKKGRGRGVPVNPETLLPKAANKSVVTEMRWIAQAAHEGLWGKKLNPDEPDRVWTMDRWIAHLGPDCKKECVPEAMAHLCDLGVMEEKDGTYGAACDLKKMRVFIGILDPRFKQEEDAWLREMAGRVRNLGLAPLP